MTTPPRRRGFLVAVEGIDGSGKSTLSGGLARSLRARGLIVASVHEPVDRRLGEHAARLSGRSPWLAAIWYTIDRAAARPRVAKALENADVVVQDRSFYSTLAYQGGALPPRRRRALEAIEREIAISPDLVVLVELDVETAVARLAARGRKRAPLERLDVLRRTARAYRRYAGRRGWLVLDGRGERGDLVRAVERRLLPRLGRRFGSGSGPNLGRRRRSRR